MRVAMASASPSATRDHHPPYKQMITAAIETLKDRKGSSRRAIAKFIANTYPGLTPGHNALLSHHLRRLRHQGHLVMLDRSYTLSAYSKRPPGRPPVNSAKPSLSLLPLVEKRRPGRPKGAILVKPQESMVVPEKRRRGRPRKVWLEGGAHGATTLASLAVVEKRRPGRPRKVLTVDSAGGEAALPSMAVPATSKKRGRARKDSGEEDGTRGDTGLPSKAAPRTIRKRGRPRKVSREDGAGGEVALPSMTVPATTKKRDRPSKDSGEEDARGATAFPSKTAPPSIRKRGRPSKESIEDGAVLPSMAVPEKRRTGRPRKVPTMDGSHESTTLPSKAPPPTIKKRGRPRKESREDRAGGEATLPSMGVPEKRRHGRSRKVSTLGGAHGTTTLTSVPRPPTMKKRGRPSKQLREVGAGGEATLASMAAMEKRRRPRKVSIAGGAHGATTLTSVPKPPTIQKRRPGRPKKPILVTLQQLVAEAKRKRGRPPKVLREDGSLNVVPLPSALVFGTKRGRGRPPKNQDGNVKMPEEMKRLEQPGKVEESDKVVLSALKKRGRPRKIRDLSELSGEQKKEKRPVGRPRREVRGK